MSCSIGRKADNISSMNFFRNKIVGIEFHDLLAQFVELKMKGSTKYELESFNRTALEPGIIENGEIKDPDKLREMVSKMFLEANPKSISPKSLALILPSKGVFSHIFSFPASFKPKDIKKSLPYEAENVIPFAIEDMYWDFQVLERQDTTQKHASQYVLFAGIPKTIADQYLKFFESMQIKPVLFGVHATTLQSALQNEVLSKGASMVVEFDAYTTNFLIVKDNTIKYFLSSAEGSEKFFFSLTKEFGLEEKEIIKELKDKSMKEDYLKKIRTFIQKKYKQAQKILEETEGRTDIGEITNIFLTGEYASLPQFLDEAQTYFEKKIIGVGDPKKEIIVNDNKFIEKHQKQGGEIPYSVFFINAIGAAKEALLGKKTINLLPDSVKKSLLQQKIEVLMSIGSVLMLLMSMGLSMFLFLKHYEVSHIRERLEIEKARVENTLYGVRYQEIKEMLVTFNSEVDQLSKIDQGLFSLPQVLEQVYSSIGEGITIKGFKFDDQNLSLELTGIADTREELLALEGSLKQLEFVEDVLAPLSNYDEKEDVSFTIIIQLKFSKLPKYGASATEQ